MKRKMFKSILCSLLIITLLAGPITSALAASNVAYILLVWTEDGTNKVIVRAGSNKRGGNGNDAILGSLPVGTPVLYWGGSSGQMLQIMTPTGQVGYIFYKNLKVYGALNRNQVFLTNSSTPVYKNSGTSIRRTGSVSAGIPLLVYGLTGGYAIVKNMFGATAYVSAASLTKVF